MEQKKEIIGHSAAFWAGYRAKTLGGRVCNTSNHIIIIDASIEPFDYLTTREKQDWRDGIKYSIAEASEIQKEFGVSPKRIYKKPYLTKCLEMLKKGSTFDQIRQKYPVSLTYLWNICNRYNLDDAMRQQRALAKQKRQKRQKNGK